MGCIEKLGLLANASGIFKREEPIDDFIDRVIKENRDNTVDFSSMNTYAAVAGTPISEVEKGLHDESTAEEKESTEGLISGAIFEPAYMKRIKKEKRGWVRTGVPGFDELIENGIPEGSNIIIAGGPGSGKTLFCLHTIYNIASRGKDCVYLSMEERPERLKDHMLSFGFKIKEIGRTEHEIHLKANDNGRISLKRLQPIQLARSVEALLEEASGTLPIKVDMVLDFIPKGFDPYMLILDSISAVETAFSGTRRQYRIYIEQLFRYFERLNLTTFIISESLEAPKRFSVTGVEEFLADGIIVFYNFPGHVERVRGVEIYKLRGTSHVRKIVPMEITDRGIIVYPDAPPLKMVF